MIASLSELREHLQYDPETGIVSWRHSGTGRRAGKTGSVTPEGYLSVTFRNRHYMAHRLAWLLAYGAWPDQILDHINGNRADNRLVNLRAANSRQNAWNSRKGSRGDLPKGVHLDSRNRRPYIAKIKVGDVHMYLGSFFTSEEAHAAYAAAAVQHYGEFARTE